MNDSENLLPAPPEPERASSARALLSGSLLLGLVVGWLDLVILVLGRWLVPTISLMTLRTNQNYLWMVPLADTLMLGTLGVLLALAVRRAPWLARGAWGLLTGLGVLALLFEVEGLHAVACFVLAAGLTTRIATPLGRLIEANGSLVRWATITLCLLLATVATASVAHNATVEQRTLANLPPARKGAPNVLFVVLDNVRATSLSLYGHSRPTTPRLDALAKQAVVFGEARSPSSWTLASHASMFTGQWCNNLSIDFDRALDATHPTLAEEFAQEGYATAGFVGNTYYGNARYGLNRGFARYEDDYENRQLSGFEVIRSCALGKRILGFLGYPIRLDQGPSQRKSAAMINRDALAWLDGRPKEQPFFLFLNYFDAHSPFIPPQGHKRMFGMAALPQNERAEIILREFRLKPDTPSDQAEKIRRDAATVRLDSYESCIAYLDGQLGLLFDALDRRGLRENTLVVVTSDHGEHFAERGFFGHGISLYGPEIRVPLLIFPPKSRADIQVGRVVNQPISLRDIAATVADLAEIAPRTAFPGTSLARYCQGNAAPTPLLAELGQRRDIQPNVNVPTSMGPLKALIHDDLVFIRNGNGREELYHLPSDPTETHNLVEVPQLRPAVDQARQKMDALISRTSDRVIR